ncbi:MAG: transposase [Chitinophagaceae bacterium]|nr:transposase [Chitinophagaceae bacterium]
MNLFHKRQGQMELHSCYFFTVTINGFRHLLTGDHFKKIVISSLQFLVNNKSVSIYGFVIMPNHIHLLWMMNKLRGNEMPSASFTKFTAHQFKNHLFHSGNLEIYQSCKQDRKYQFWKRDPLAILISTEKIFWSKLDYIHNNPTKEKWGLCSIPEDYRWSSAKFYRDGFDEFSIVTHYKD